MHIWNHPSVSKCGFWMSVFLPWELREFSSFLRANRRFSIQALCASQEFTAAPVNGQDTYPITFSARALRQPWYHAIVTAIKAVCFSRSSATIWCHDQDVCPGGYIPTVKNMTAGRYVFQVNVPRLIRVVSSVQWKKTLPVQSANETSTSTMADGLYRYIVLVTPCR